MYGNQDKSFLKCFDPFEALMVPRRSPPGVRNKSILLPSTFEERLWYYLRIVFYSFKKVRGVENKNVIGLLRTAASSDIGKNLICCT